jgi:DNA-binding winged helix-turn-helix (wHTH) protein
VLEKAELMNRVWTDTTVEESNLTQHIYTLRKLFSAEPEGGKYIETIPRRGYRFVARVNETGSDADDSARVEMRASPDHVEGRVISFPYASNLAPAPIADQETAELDQEADPHRQHPTEGASPGLTVAEGARVQSVPKLDHAMQRSDRPQSQFLRALSATGSGLRCKADVWACDRSFTKGEDFFPETPPSPWPALVRRTPWRANGRKRKNY